MCWNFNVINITIGSEKYRHGEGNHERQENHHQGSQVHLEKVSVSPSFQDNRFSKATRQFYICSSDSSISFSGWGRGGECVLVNYISGVSWK